MKETDVICAIETAKVCLIKTQMISDVYESDHDKLLLVTMAGHILQAKAMAGASLGPVIRKGG